MSDRSLMKQQEASALGTVLGVSNATDEVGKAHSILYTFSKAADDGMASTATSETFTGIYIPYACQVRNITYSATTGGITADNTNFATVTVSKRDSAGANLTTIATLTTTITSSGNITQGAGKGLVLTAANIQISAGSTITFSIAKSGSGVIVRAGTITLELESI